MTTLLRTVELLSLSLWLGADAFLSFVVAPGAFALLGSRDAAGMLVGFSLTRLHIAGICLGALFLLARLLWRQDFAGLSAPAVVLVALMVVLTAASQFTVSTRMEALKKQMVSVQSTPEDHPLRVQFNRLHRISVAYETGVLLAGVAAMYFLVAEWSQAAPVPKH